MDILDLVLSPGISLAGSPFQSISRCGYSETDVDLTSRVELGIPFITLALDVFIFGLTLRKTVHHAFAMRKIGESSVTQLILRDGSVYFLIMLVVGIFATIASLDLLHTTSNVAGSFFNLVTPFFSILPNILISRLVLNLRTFCTSEELSRITHDSAGKQYSGLQFATNSILGNIGAPLDGGAMEEEEEESHSE
ncbi:hypothetical protein GYMLUDRAFT_50870 [Collybiopsis luxurians FD-317 M1]|uniref:Uncharacterized protein n=1 Tax=Collybiopsis luxurians FD-317 M1 TaxID=944289 RepID=A0A0D0B9R7_9AGAR|nr:hypothetical protein GYMLUDRAFT_50870 [Collybiopsis luxurians FD-317 M1]